MKLGTKLLIAHCSAKMFVTANMQYFHEIKQENSPALKETALIRICCTSLIVLKSIWMYLRNKLVHMYQDGQFGMIIKTPGRNRETVSSSLRSGCWAPKMQSSEHRDGSCWKFETGSKYKVSVWGCVVTLNGC